MNYNVDIKNIKCAKYGQLNKIIDVTQSLKDKLQKDGRFSISENFPVNKMLVLYVYFNDNTKISAMHGSTILIEKTNIILSPINNTNSIKLINSNNNNYILSTNVRDEPNILEWIIYHLLIGFDKIVIIDHNSKIPILNLIQNYEWKNRIHVIRRTDEGAVKMKFLNEIIVPYMYVNCKKYFIHLDADEYLYIDYPNIETFLNTIGNKYNANILTLNWLMFGNNNVTKNTHPNNFLIPTFTKSDLKLSNHFKCFIKVTQNMPFIFTNPHTIKFIREANTIYTTVLNNKVKYTNDTTKLFSELYINEPIINVPAYINHYYVQSKEDYILRKLNRGRDDNNEKRQMEKDIFNKYNDIDNKNLEKYSENILYILNNVKTFGFILLRYVNSEETNKSWIRCYNSIRKFYNNKIIIIDDNSNPKYLTNIDYYNTTVINSEFPRRGELLPYYYYIKNNFFFRAVILHDSMEIIKYYDFMNINSNIKYNNYSRLFSFENNCYQIDIEFFKEMSTYIKYGQNVYKYHLSNKTNLVGCFGVCYVIDNNFLQDIENKYNISNLVNFIDNRKKRMNLERFLSCLFEYHRGKSFITPTDIFGNIHKNNNSYIKKYFYGR
jgi:hypothetical protein